MAKKPGLGMAKIGVDDFATPSSDHASAVYGARGLRNPTVVTLYHLASALGVSHVELG